MNDVLFLVIYGSLVGMILITIYCLLCVPRKRKRSGTSLWAFYRNMKYQHYKEREEKEEY